MDQVRHLRTVADAELVHGRRRGAELRGQRPHPPRRSVPPVVRAAGSRRRRWMPRRRCACLDQTDRAPAGTDVTRVLRAGLLVR